MTGADEAERKRLLEALLDLERRHARGDLSDERFKQEDAALRRRLRDLLAGAEATMTPQPVARAVETTGAEAVEEQADAGAAEPAPGSRGGAR